MMLACLAVIWGGVCEKHPKIRIGFLESGGGWIAPWLDRMDRHFDDQGFNDSGLTTRPSELFQRNCWISFEPVEGSLKVLADYVGPHKIMWATDYPHPDGFFPGAPDMVREAARRPVARDQAPGDGRRRHGLLRAKLDNGCRPGESRDRPLNRLNRCTVGPGFRFRRDDNAGIQAFRSALRRSSRGAPIAGHKAGNVVGEHALGVVLRRITDHLPGVGDAPA